MQGSLEERPKRKRLAVAGRGGPRSLVSDPSQRDVGTLSGFKEGREPYLHFEKSLWEDGREGWVGSRGVGAVGAGRPGGEGARQTLDGMKYPIP